jgi:hypothetical protein
MASKTVKRETGANLGFEVKLSSAVLILFLKKPNQPQDGTEIIYWRDEK